MRRVLSTPLGLCLGASLVAGPAGAAELPKGATTGAAGADARSTSLAGADARSTSLAGADARSSSLAGADARSTSLAGADAPAELVSTRPATRRSFYGWQILASGGAGGLLAAGAIFLPNRPLGSLPATATFMVAMPVYAIGGPAVHWTHGDFWRGLVSFGGNVALPLLGGFVGQAIRCRPSNAPNDCGGLGFFAGFGIGLLTAPLVDAIALGWEDIPVDYIGALEHRSAGRHSIVSRFSIAPAWSFGHGSIELGLSGRF